MTIEEILQRCGVIFERREIDDGEYVVEDLPFATLAKLVLTCISQGMGFDIIPENQIFILTFYQKERGV